jgi:predicted phosphoribosyltransferase
MMDKVSWVYRDRAQAGTVLADLLVGYADRDEVTVLALPRGGVPVAAPIAHALQAPLDILAVRKLGVPGHEELAMGALAEGGIRVVNADVVAGLEIDEETINAATRVEVGRLAEQETRFRGNRPAAPRAGRCVVLVDDGLATGATMEAAIVSCRQAGAAWIVVAVPIGAPPTVDRLRTLADDVQCPLQPRSFRAVGLAYADFSPVPDSEVVALLADSTVRRDD